MQIVIDIPEDFYERVNEDGCMSYTDAEVVMYAFFRGKVLPKGHGALKDETTLKKMLEDKEGDDFTAFHFYYAIDDCPTIIEADKEVDE